MRILFIGTGFYQYDQYILSELQKYGDVCYINSKKSESNHSLLFSLFDRIKCHRSFRVLASREIQKELESFGNTSFDLVFVIKGEYLSEDNMSFVKRNSPKAKYILYLWDAWSRHDNRDVLLKYFSDIYSFDVRDCKNYGFKLRPLFYINKIEQLKKERATFNISFVGGNHSGRLDYLKAIKQICKESELTYCFKLLIGRFDSFKLRLLIKNNNVEDVVTSEFVPYKDYLNILDKSISVIDIPNPLQSGLTIRTIEALSRGVKVVTTNSFIKDYDHIPKTLILVVDEKNINREQFVRFVSESSNERLDEYYSLEHFIKEFVS